MKRLAFTGLAAELVLLGAASHYAQTLPDSYYTQTGQSLSLSTLIPITAEQTDAVIPSMQTVTVPATETASLKLLGFFPIKEISITEVDTPVLIPGGEPFGIKLLIDGVMVVGMDTVDSSPPRCPAEQAGIEVGDVIVSVNGTAIATNEELQAEIAETDGQAAKLEVQRGSAFLTLSLQPAYSETSGCWQGGMWVRDSTAGIGTVTFYAQDGRFAGLGHAICDADTGAFIPLSSGEIAAVSIHGVQPGAAGKPGELQGCFLSSGSVGSLYLNNSAGVFGTVDSMQTALRGDRQGIPLALRQEVQTGPAEILSTISGTEPQRYEIEIESIDYRGTDSKNMIIHVTDEALLSQTGGIVQGMSGSPILQNGKLVGAVTHVFVNDPTRGYSIFAETMYSVGFGA